MRSLCRVSVHGAGLGGSLASLRLSPPREGLGAGHRQGDRQAARDGDQAWLRDYEAAAREVFAALPPERRPLRGRGDRHRRPRSGAAPPTPAPRQHHPDLAAPLPPASDAAPQRAHRSGVPAPPRPSGPGRSQPPRGVVGGAAVHLAQQALLAVQVEEAGVPPVGRQGVLPGLLIDGGPGPAAAVLVDARVRHRCRWLVRRRVRGGGERVVRGRPGDSGVPGRLRRSDPPFRGLMGGLLAQPGRDLRHRGGSCGTGSVNVLRGQAGLPHLRRTMTHRRSTGSPARRASRGRASTISCTRSETAPHSGHAAAAG